MITTLRLDPNSVGKGLLALLDTLDPVHADLGAEDVHRLRVAIKQTRAWLKLCRGMSGKTTAYHQLVENLRVLSAGLAGQRDRDVALQTLAKLARRYPGKKAEHLIDALRPLIAQQQPVLHDLLPLGATIEQIRQGLLPFTQLVIPRATLTAVVNRVYAKMCKTGDRALMSQTCADLHVWRKQVKTLGYQLAMLPFAEASVKKSIAHLTKLGSKLGGIHDLCFLAVMVEDVLAASNLELELTPLLKRIARERERLSVSVCKLHLHVCKPIPVLEVGNR